MKKFIYLKPFIRDFFLYLGILSFFFMLPYWRVWSTIGMFFFLFGLAFSKFRNISSFTIAQKSVIIGFAGITLLYLSAALFSAESKNWFELQKRVALFIIPFSILLNNDLKENHIVLALKSFVVGILLLNIISLTKTVIFYFENGTLPFSNGPDIYQILIIDRPYFGLLNSLACTSLLFLFQNKKTSSKVTYITIAFCVFMVNLITARAAMGIIVVVLILHILFSYQKKHINKIVAWLGLAIGLMSIMFYMNTNLQERFKNMEAYEPRTLIWPSVVNIVQQDSFDYLLGAHGEIEGQKLLNLQYKKEYEKGSVWEWVYREKVFFNTHNQYLGMFLNFGSIGLLFYLAPFLICFYEALKTKNFFLLAITFVFFTTSIVENITARQVGVYALTMFLSLALIVRFILPKSLNKRNE